MFSKPLSGVLMWHRALAGNRTQASSLQQALQGSGIDPAQALVVADRQQLSIDSVINLLHAQATTLLLQRSAEEQADLSGDPLSTLLQTLRAHSSEHEINTRYSFTALPDLDAWIQQAATLDQQWESALEALRLYATLELSPEESLQYLQQAVKQAEQVQSTWQALRDVRSEPRVRELQEQAEQLLSTLQLRRLESQTQIQTQLLQLRMLTEQLLQALLARLNDASATG
jgi:hypothetical protein